MERSALVWYVELRGTRAQASLGIWLDSLPQQPGFLGAELLSSPAQPGLALVASRWAQQLPDLALPDGAKAWSFCVVAAR